MSNDVDRARRAYEAARAHQRAHYEKYHPPRALGARPAEVVTPEALLEMERLDAASNEARIAWETAKRARD